ncbi:glycosyltransferase family 4 protein [Aliifodinibius salicampi]|uniref:Glycosyltransferase family 4 protein n=1 Tax=Fodinibius salicampi TaxID=1920655 RepID=A0ABT3PV58_9BACT|nr:glycosyltransferase family 4 protein [Fodinibius salicampi]MCW9711727.1 glycosyltransferase family 4 protein [Fodinibius salicampi]
MLTIGYSNRTRYWQKYVFNNPPIGVKYKRAIDIPFHLMGISNQFLKHTKWMIPLQNCDMYHTYNSIVGGYKPWVVEVESDIPRYGPMNETSRLFRWGIKRLRSNQCKKIIFTSECSRELNRENFSKWGIDEDKCHVVYRAVEPHKPLERSGEETKFSILMVGNAFYRKGGIELLKAFEQFDHDDVSLTIISNFEVDWAMYPTPEEKEYVARSINRDPRINVLSNISHQKVINWMRRSDIFVSTTYADPFNNTVLEALSCSLPVITTDVRAIPEFVIDDYNGFIYELDENIERESIISFVLGKLNNYYDNQDLLQRHSENALEMVKSKFLIEHRNKLLIEKIYAL